MILTSPRKGDESVGKPQTQHLDDLSTRKLGGLGENSGRSTAPPLPTPAPRVGSVGDLWYLFTSRKEARKAVELHRSQLLLGCCC